MALQREYSPSKHSQVNHLIVIGREEHGTHPDSFVLNPRLLSGQRHAAFPRELDEGLRTRWDRMHLAFPQGSGTDNSPAYTQVGSNVPSSAISNDVFPDPVGPTTRLIWPLLNSTSPSTFSTNLRCLLPLLMVPGVVGVDTDDGDAPSFAHVNVVCLMPIVPSSGMGRRKFLPWAGPCLASSYSSRSSVYTRASVNDHQKGGEKEREAYVVQERVDTVQRYLSWRGQTSTLSSYAIWGDAILALSDYRNSEKHQVHLL